MKDTIFVDYDFFGEVDGQRGELTLTLGDVMNMGLSYKNKVYREVYG